MGFEPTTAWLQSVYVTAVLQQLPRYEMILFFVKKLPETWKQFSGAVVLGQHRRPDLQPRHRPHPEADVRGVVREQLDEVAGTGISLLFDGFLPSSFYRFLLKLSFLIMRSSNSWNVLWSFKCQFESSPVIVILLVIDHLLTTTLIRVAIVYV